MVSYEQIIIQYQHYILGKNSKGTVAVLYFIPHPDLTHAQKQIQYNAWCKYLEFHHHFSGTLELEDC